MGSFFLAGRKRVAYEDKFRSDPITPGLFHCLLCGKGVRNKHNHFRTHFPGDHKCWQCGVVYCRLDKLKSHLRSVHNIECVQRTQWVPLNLNSASDW
jgi:hypothetical protein